MGGKRVDPHRVFQLHGKAFHGVQGEPPNDEGLRLLRYAQLARLDLDDQLPNACGTEQQGVRSVSENSRTRADNRELS